MNKFYKILFILLMFFCQAQTIKIDQTNQSVHSIIKETIKENYLETCNNEWEDLGCDDGNTYNGFWWFQRWIPGLPDYPTQFLEYPLLTIGKAAFYGPRVMEGTVTYRGLNLNNYVGGVALMTCDDLRKSVWLQRPGLKWEGPFLVVDCARRNDLYGIIIYREEVVEVDFKTALRWGMIASYDFMSGDYEVAQWMIRDVLVSKIRPDLLPLQTEIVNLSNWFLENVTYSHGTMQDWIEWHEIALSKNRRISFTKR